MKAVIASSQTVGPMVDRASTICTYTSLAVEPSVGRPGRVAPSRVVRSRVVRSRVVRSWIVRSNRIHAVLYFCVTITNELPHNFLKDRISF